MAEVAESKGCSPGTSATYSRHYVAKIADRLISQAVDNEGDYDAWMHEFNTFKHSLRNTSKRDSLLARYLRLVIENIARQGIPVSFHEVTRRSGSGYPAITKAINNWERSEEHRSELQYLIL